MNVRWLNLYQAHESENKSPWAMWPTEEIANAMQDPYRRRVGDKAGTGFTHFRRFYRLWQGMWKGKRRTKAKQVVWSSETKPATNVMQGLGS